VRTRPWRARRPRCATPSERQGRARDRSDRARVLGLSAHRRRVQPVVEHRHALVACGLFDVDGLLALPGAQRGPARPPALVRHAHCRRRFRGRHLPLVLRGRPRATRGRSDHGRHDRRHRRGAALVRSRAACARRRVAHRLRNLPGLWPVRPIPARRTRAPRLRARPDRFAIASGHRRHLRHPDPGVGDLHLLVHPVRRIPGARRHDPAVQ